MAELTVSHIPSQLFSYDKRYRELVTERSTIEGNGYEMLSRVWDDALDEGFVVVSQWTGTEVLFTHRSTERDEEGDYISWTFESFGLDRRVRAIIFND